eukprot:6190833-Pleurochrysis_carterae.AAC.5
MATCGASRSLTIPRKVVASDSPRSSGTNARAWTHLRAQTRKIVIRASSVRKIVILPDFSTMSRVLDAWPSVPRTGTSLVRPTHGLPPILSAAVH